MRIFLLMQDLLFFCEISLLKPNFSVNYTLLQKQKSWPSMDGSGVDVSSYFHAWNQYCVSRFAENGFMLFSW
jgi:hypothetical protein